MNAAAAARDTAADAVAGGMLPLAGHRRECPPVIAPSRDEAQEYPGSSHLEVARHSHRSTALGWDGRVSVGARRAPPMLLATAIPQSIPYHTQFRKHA